MDAEPHGMSGTIVKAKKEESPVYSGAKRHARPHTPNSDSPEKLDFKTAMDAAGLTMKDPIIPDGKLHRFQVVDDKAGSQNGWYVYYGDDLPAGAFGCWKRGVSETWYAQSDRKLTKAQKEQNRRRMIDAQKAREAEEVEQRKAARDKALLIWNSSIPAPDNHSYLLKKSVKSHGLRLYKAALVVPMQDYSGTLHSLQFINNEGDKRFLSGGLKKGCYFLIREPMETLCIAEGYATAATIYESTCIPVAVAFDAGNLLPVATALRIKYPYIKIILCADNDERTPGNPGLTKAREAAVAVGALLAVPPCVGDFNDLLTRQLAQ